MTEDYQEGLLAERRAWLQWTGEWPGFTEHTVLPWLQKRLDKEAKDQGFEPRQLLMCRCGHLNIRHKKGTRCAAKNCSCTRMEQFKKK